MTPGPAEVALGDRFDITLDAVERVAWHGERVALETAATARMDECAAAFDALVAARVRADPAALIYGVTSAPGDAARAALDAEGQARRPTRLWTAMSYGEPLPERVTRAIALARLANFLGGHAAARARVASAVADMLNGSELPAVPSQSNGGSGEILPLGTLFYELSGRLELSAKERMALINGSPCAAALTADVALAGRARLAVAEQVFALVAEITGTPREHYAVELEELWGDEHEAAALRSLRSLVGETAGAEQNHQAAVSLRILPRVLGAVRRAQAGAERAAEVSLRAVTDNPVFLPPGGRHPDGAVHSTGGYHNAQAAPAIDALAFAHADLCQLSERLSDHLFVHPGTAALVGGDEWSVKPLHMSINGWAEEARGTVGPTLLSLGSFGQNDVPELAFIAWRKATAAARCVDGALAGLAVLASQVLHKRGEHAPEPLRGLLDSVRAIVPPVDEPRPLGVECQRLYERLTDAATGGAPFA
ncbi:MAG TPA: aromatic amino acid lyase [Solirubrobacteraceae bacterium]|nr:aromatic amino acid lyase [Solirubrobacteraceae bacterium]